jgi:hypothetical protein
VFAPRPLLPDDAELADDLAAWLTANLAADEDSAAPQPADDAAASLLPASLQPAGWQHSAAGWQPGGGAPPPASLQLAQSVMWQEALPLPYSEPPQQAQAPGPRLHPQSLQYQQYHLQQQHHQPAMQQHQPAMQQHQPAMQQQQHTAIDTPQLPTGAAAAAPALPPSVPGPTLAAVSVKLFGCTPAELPSGLRDHLK